MKELTAAQRKAHSQAIIKRLEAEEKARQAAADKAALERHRQVLLKQKEREAQRLVRAKERAAFEAKKAAQRKAILGR
jgi:hypothetical protein